MATYTKNSYDRHERTQDFRKLENLGMIDVMCESEGSIGFKLDSANDGNRNRTVEGSKGENYMALTS